MKKTLLIFRHIELRAWMWKNEECSSKSDQKTNKKEEGDQIRTQSKKERERERGKGVQIQRVKGETGRKGSNKNME